MQVKEAMTRTPCYCQPETNLGSATELMWNVNCGFLPVVASGKVVGAITDRDISIALGTRNRLAGEVTVGEVMTGAVYACAPSDDIKSALRTMKDAKVRRLPVITSEGALIGVISMDDILSRAEFAPFGKKTELSSDEVVKTYQEITRRQVPQVAQEVAAA